jgi:2'-5' RNA ligase
VTEVSNRRSQRLFIALDLPAGLRATLAALPLDPEWRPIPPENLHVTLVFLGDRPLGDLPRIVEAERAMPELRLGPIVRLRKVLAVELGDPTGALAAMQARIATALDHDEGRPFRPHVTIARARPRTRPRGTTLQLAPQTFHGRSVTLYASHLSPAGARYEVLATSGYIQP